MELYSKTAQELSRITTLRYSSSFSLSTMLFPKNMRGHIYNIYGLVRIADEIVDTYGGKDAVELLDDLERETISAIKRGYSPNPIIHAFILTVNAFTIDTALIHDFFASMRMDITPLVYTQKLYDTYIHGSAEVIGLMCLYAFIEGDNRQYESLKNGASSLGAAYQKVNFLRDLTSDYQKLGRVYFPDVVFETFDDQKKAAIISDIDNDFSLARSALKQLPRSARRATALSFHIYSALLEKLRNASSDEIKQKRIRIGTAHKLWIFCLVSLGILK